MTIQMQVLWAYQYSKHKVQGWGPILLTPPLEGKTRADRDVHWCALWQVASAAPVSSQGSQADPGGPAAPLAARFLFQIVQFQAIFRGKPVFSKLWGSGPPPLWGQDSTTPDQSPGSAPGTIDH